MTATLKTTIIQEPSSATANMTLDTSGGVAFGQNLSVAGTTTLTGGIASAGLPLKGASSGTTTLAAQSVASGTVTIPAGTGTAAVNGVSSNIVQGTSVASTSGTAITFTGIPSWVKRVILMLNGVTTNSTSNLLIQVGSGSTTTTGYVASTTNLQQATAVAVQNSTAGFPIWTGSSSDLKTGQFVFASFGSNTWVGSYVGKYTTNGMTVSSGSIALSGALDRINITTVSGTDTFTAGSINILYE